MNVSITLRFADCVWAFHLALLWFCNGKLGKGVFDAVKESFCSRHSQTQTTSKVNTLGLF